MAGDLPDNQGRGDVRWSLPPIHPEGRKYGLITLAVSLVFLVGLDWEIVGWPLLALSAGIFAFFRDPERVVPQDDSAILSPADGQVTMIAEVEPPRELVIDDGSGIGGLSPDTVTRVSIFLSVFDVHINRTPIAGTVQRVVYPRKFRRCRSRQGERRKRQHILVERSDGTKVGFTQIAGLVARRIVPFVKPGDTLGAGQRVGLIRFGSRVDVYLPAGTGSDVLLGQRVVAGETVIARLGARKLLEGVSQ